MILSLYAGDRAEFVLPLRRARKAFDPGVTYNTIFTVYSRNDDMDSTELFNIQTGANLVVAEGEATATVLPANTADLESGKYEWDLRCVNTGDATDAFTLAGGVLVLLVHLVRPAVPPASTDALRFDIAQTLTAEELEQLWTNAGLTAYDDLTAANAALAPGLPYYDRALETMNITTA